MERRVNLIIPAHIQVNIDQKQVKEFIEKDLQKQINQQLLLVDINKLSEITSMSKRFLEEEILHDPRVRMHERKKSRKRWWLYEPVVEAIKDVIDEW